MLFNPQQLLTGIAPPRPQLQVGQIAQPVAPIQSIMPQSFGQLQAAFENRYRRQNPQKTLMLESIARAMRLK